MISMLLAAARTDLGGWKWTALPPGWVLTLIAIVLFVFVRMLYRLERGRAGRTTRLLLAGLRTAVLLLVILVLAGPYREEVRLSEERSHLVILVDTSGSMDTSDRYPEAEVGRLRGVAWPEDVPVTDEEILETSRLDLVRRVLGAEDEALLRELDRRFAIHVFAFDVDWRGLGSTGDATPDGEEDTGDDGGPVRRVGQSIRDLEAIGGGTDLGSVLRSVAGEFLGREDRRLAGVLLVSDGRNTAGGEGALESLAGLGRTATDLQVTAVALGNPSSGRNVRVERVRAMDWVLLEDDVVFETALRHVGFVGLEGVRAEATIEKVADAEGQPLAEPRPYAPPEGAVLEAGPFTLGAEDQAVPVRLRARMREVGTFRIRVRVVLPPEDAELDAVREDDVATHELRVVDQRIQVLYVDNLPRYEQRFLGNWLTREPEPDPTRPEVRSRYDAQVLLQSADPTVDQPHSATTSAIRRFPRTRSELFAYDVIVIGDIDWMRLAGNAGSAAESRAILALIRDFVAEGGGVVLQAGADYHNPLGFRDTPLKELLPITPRDRDRNASDDTGAAFRVHLTDVGKRHPIFGVVPGAEGGIASPDEVADVWKGTARFARYAQDWKWYWMYRALGGLRPGAVDLARAYPDQGPLDRAMLDETGRPVIVFATMPFGKGRVFYSALDSVWRIRKGQSDRFYGPFWDQVIRYLATYRLLGGNKRFKITTDKEDYFAGEVATVTITALDRDFEPVEDPYLDGVHVEGPGGEDLRLEGDDRPVNLRPEGAAPGTFRLHLPLRKKGTYRIWIRDTASADRGGGSRAERRVQVEYRAPELRQTIPDHDLLRQIVDATGGRLVDERLARLHDLDELARTLPAPTQQRVVDRRERTQWDAPWVLLLLVGLLGIEWALRKRWQMI